MESEEYVFVLSCFMQFWTCKWLCYKWKNQLHKAGCPLTDHFKKQVQLRHSSQSSHQLNLPSQLCNIFKFKVVFYFTCERETSELCRSNYLKAGFNYFMSFGVFLSNETRGSESAPHANANAIVPLTDEQWNLLF